MPKIDVVTAKNVVTQDFRRWMAMRELEPLLRQASVLPGADEIARFYEFIGDAIGCDTPIRYLEFGVAGGRSMRLLSSIFTNAQSEFFGFDSFEGLPEPWEHHERGAFSSGGSEPRLTDQRVKFVKGWFQNTLPQHLSAAGRREDKTVLVHFDADLYSATLFVLSCLWFHVPEYYFIFDELPFDEAVALRDFASSFPVKLEFFGQTRNAAQAFGKLRRVEFIPAAN